ncbi:MAG: DUF262 domain-containing protein [Planctomycetota bacterium]
METNKTALFDLFRRERQYRVPLFQRPYVWSQEKQWEPLWQDVVDRTEAVLDSQASKLPRQAPGNHFLGAIVTRHAEVFGKQIDAAEVIDGQQRLTTTQVMLKAFFDYLQNLDAESKEALAQVASDVGTLTKNSGVMATEHEAFKVWPTNADRDTFRLVMTAGSVSDVEQRFPLVRRKWQRKYDPRPRLAEAYLYFHEAVRGYCADSKDGTVEGVVTRANALHEALRRHLLLVHIELSKDDDPQVIFESLNGRGEPLLPSDLIRNFVFMRAGTDQKDVDAIYASAWREYDEKKAQADSQGEDRFWKQLERQGRLLRPRLDLFVFHYLQCQVGEEFSIGHLFQTFRRWWDRAPRDVEQELVRMKDHSGKFAALVAPEGDDAQSVFAQRLKAVDTSTVYPIVLYLLVGGGQRVDREQLPGMLADIESYLIRRLICDLTPKSYNKTFLALLKRLINAERIDRALIQGFLLDGSGPAVVWPDDAAFRKAWMTRPIYDDLNATRVSVILEAINSRMHTAKQEPIQILSSLTVEHVMPVKWTTSWAAPTAHAATGDSESPDDRRNRLLHTFGNLTLLTRELNSGVSNGPYATKRVEIADQSLIRLNLWFREVATWDEASIEQRGAVLCDVAVQVWQHPSTSSLTARS